MTLIELINLKLAILAVLSQVIILLIILYYVFFRSKYGFIQNFLTKHGLLFAFLTALAATLGSLFYSEVAGYEPCTLCWYQRILMYSQVVILGLAVFKKDRGIIPYALTLSVMGAALALYHYVVQLGLIGGVACSLVGYSVSCAKLFVMRFGYITIPLMSFTAFLSIILFLVFSRIHPAK